MERWTEKRMEIENRKQEVQVRVEAQVSSLPVQSLSPAL